jgi:alcohol dehydrogenase
LVMWLYGTSVFVVIAAVAVVAIRRLPVPVFWDSPAAVASSKETMAAVAYNKHGDAFVLKLNSHFPRPIPQDDQVLVEVYATSVNPVDYKFRRSWMPSTLIPKPKIPGADVAGVVVELGSNITKFKIGDRCAAFLPLLGSQWGSSAEFVAVRESHLSLIPESVSFIKAAALPLVALTVIQSFHHLDTASTKGKSILIQAGAGGVGTFAIQYAKNILEMNVSTTTSQPKFKLVKALGADHVIDYHTQDFSEIVTDYDVVLDPMSWKYEHLTLNQGKNVLKKNGHYLNVLSSEVVNGREKTLGFTTLYNLLRHTIMNIIYPDTLPKYSLIGVKPDGDGLRKVFDLVEHGTITSVIDPQIFDLYELSDAHMYLERHYATGKVVVRVKQT